MTVPQVVASYLPESMIIKIGPHLRLLDDNGNPAAFATAESLGYFFHEYTHYLHNISTASGISVFFNTLELWRTFRRAHDETGFCNGSEAHNDDQKEFLKNLLACLKAARRQHMPPANNILNPVSITLDSFKLEPEVQIAGEVIFSAIKYEAEIKDSHGQIDKVNGSIGTVELLESAAWLLEKRAVSAVSPTDQAQPPPVFPYRVVEALAECALPGLDEGTVLLSVLAALQSSDAPAALIEVLEIVRKARIDGDNPAARLRDCTIHAISMNYPQLEQTFAKLEEEFSGDGILAVAIRQIVNSARASFKMRQNDPFFELDFIDQLGKRELSFDSVIKRIPSCAVLQRNIGCDDDIQRDFLLSFLPPDNGAGIDPEDGLRIVHCIFDYIGRHRDADRLVPTDTVPPRPCPFYTSCGLALRDKDAAICRDRPWKAADCPDWDDKGACWYGTGVRITRPLTEPQD